MRFTRLAGSLAICAAAITAGSIYSFHHVQAQSASPSFNPHPPIYNPYPPGILPADLTSEIARVQREVHFIYNEAIAEWGALPPPNVQSNPPTLQGKADIRPWKYWGSC